MAKRKSIPRATQDQVLILSGRRCCLCFGLSGDFTEKKGQIAHLDHNPSNNDLDNLVWLCFNHHDDYDSQTRQSKGLTEGEVKHYRERLYGAVSGLHGDHPIPISVRRAQLFLHGDFSTFTTERQSTVIDTLAGLLGIPSQDITVYSVHDGSVALDLGLPSEAIERLRRLLETNNAQLRMLRIEKIILETGPNETETWILQEGWFTIVGKPNRTEGDTIYAEVGEGARHVAIGKNIQVIGMMTLFPAPSRHPLQRPPRAPHFTGREDELRDVLAQLQPGQVVTLCGPGGIGKTALAAEAIWSLAPGNDPPERFPDGIFFHTFYNQPEAALALEAIARAYGEEPRPSPRDAAARALGERVALLVLDGAENADDLGAVLSVAGRCGVLITTRRHTDAPAGWEDIHPLPNPQAVELLQAWGGDCVADVEAAARICTLVGALPLAVRLAGRYMAQRGEEAADYLEWLERTPLLALHFGDRQRESAQMLMERSAAQLSEAALQALGVVGILALASFDRSAVAAALDPSVPATGLVLGELVNYGLLLRDEQGRYQASHALVHTYARERLGPSVELVEKLAGDYANFARAQRDLGLPGYARLDTERAHIAAVLEKCVEREAWEAARSLAWAVDSYLDIRGYWVERLVTLEAGLNAAQALGHRRDEGAFLGNLGLAYSALGQVERAIEYHEQALVIAREIGDRGGEGKCLGNLGPAYRDLGQVERAIEYHEQALVIAREIADRRGEGAELGNLGNAYNVLGQVERAIDYYHQALVIAREIADWRGEGARLGNLGSAYRDLGQVERAIEYHEQALVIAREIGDRRNEGVWLGNLGSAYSDLGQVKRAVEYHEQALVIAREIGDRLSEAYRVWNLGLLYEESDPARAVELMSIRVAYEREIGHPDVEAHAERVAKIQARL